MSADTAQKVKLLSSNSKHGGFQLKHGGETGAQEAETRSIRARWAIKTAVFSLFDAFPGPHFCSFITENDTLSREMMLEAL